MAYPINSPTAKFHIGLAVRHRIYGFRGIIFDVDPEFANTEEWYESIPENVRPSKDQPFYHLLAENDDSYYGAYVSEGNLLPDSENGPVEHPVGQLRSDLALPALKRLPFTRPSGDLSAMRYGRVVSSNYLLC